MKKYKELQDDVAQSAHRIWLAGLGAVAYAQEGGEKLFTELIDRGRQMEARAKLAPPQMTDTLRGATGKAMTAWAQLGKGMDEQVTAALHRMGVPTRREIATLSKRVELLTASIEKLKPKARPLAKSITRTPSSGAPKS